MRSGSVVPTLESLLALGVVLPGWPAVATQVAMPADWRKCGKETLGLTRRLAAPHLAFLLARRLVGVVCSVV